MNANRRSFFVGALRALGIAFLSWVAAVLAALSSALRTELAEVLVSLDAVRNAGTIRRVAESDPTLARMLERRARQLQYTVILQALQSCPDGVQAQGGVV